MSSQTGGRAWSVLAQIPDVSNQELSQAAGPVSTASTAPAYRFDLPEPPRPHTSVAKAKRGVGAIAIAAEAAGRLPGATGFPLWAKPSEVPANDQSAAATKRGGDNAATIVGALVRFLLMVALFTAAGLSIRLACMPPQPTTSSPVETPSRAMDATTASSAAKVPPTTTPVPGAESQASPVAPAAIAAKPSPAAAAAPQALAVSEMPAERIADRSPVTVVYPKTLQPMPGENDPLEADNSAAGPSTPSPAVAQLPGYILEVPPRQAQHEHDELHVQ